MRRLEFLERLPWVAEGWKPVSKPALAGWLVFYVLFLLYAFSARGRWLFVDNVNLVVHEGGHLLFSYLGEFMGLLGGTLLQLLVPAALALYFAWQRHLPGTAFALFFLFQNLLGISIYMADARAQALPLVSVGGGDIIEHDWLHIFSRFGVLHHDRRIAGFTELIGWVGMLGSTAWLGYRSYRQGS